MFSNTKIYKDYDFKKMFIRVFLEHPKEKNNFFERKRCERQRINNNDHSEINKGLEVSTGVINFMRRNEDKEGVYLL